MGHIYVSAFLLTVLFIFDYTDGQLCPGSQNLELGERGIIQCLFPKEYYGVYWYDTQDVTQQPIIYNENSNKGGVGFISGEFDLHSDGSLIITRVTIEHEIAFTVVLFEFKIKNRVPETIEVNVFAYPTSRYPVIDKCENEQYCYEEFNNNDTLKCTVHDARPPVHLSWVVRTIEGDSGVTSQRSYIPNGDLNTTTTTMKFQYFPSLHFHMFVCIADDTTLLGNLSSFIIAEVDRPTLDLANVPVKEMVNGDLLKLPCNEDDTLFFIWKKSVSETQYDVIAHGYITEGKTFSEHPYIVNHDGSLLIRELSEINEGVYVCYTSNGVQENIVVYEVISEADNKIPAVEKNTPVAAILIPLFLVTLIVVGILVWFFKVRRRQRKNDNNTNEGEHVSVSEKELFISSTNATTVNETEKSPSSENVPLIPKTEANPTETDEKSDQVDNQRNTTSMQDNHPGHSHGQPYIHIKQYVVGKRTSSCEKRVVFLIGGGNIEENMIDLHMVETFTGVLDKKDLKYDDIVEDNNSVLQYFGIKRQLCTIKSKFSPQLPFDITFVVIYDSIETSNTTDIKRFNEITNQLHHLATCNGTYQLKHVDAVVVIQDISQVPAFPPESILHHPLLRIFGKDLHNKIHLIVTCTTEGGFPNLTLVEDNVEYPVAVHFSFHNGELIEQICVSVKCTSDMNVWGDHSKCNFDNFSRSLETEQVNLDGSIAIFEKRKNVLEAITNVNKNMKEKEELCSKLQKKQQYLDELKSRKIFADVTVTLKKGEMAMNCLQCKTTCHYPCDHIGIKPCSCMTFTSLYSNCGICQNSCGSLTHERQTFRYKSDEEMNKEINVHSIEETIRETNLLVSKNVDEINSCLEYLNENAITPTVLSVEGNIDNALIMETINEEYKWEDCLTKINALKDVEEI